MCRPGRIVVRCCPMTKRRKVAGAAGAALWIGVAGCLAASCGGDEFSTTCAATVGACAANETCWATTDGYQCIAAGNGGVGAPCTIRVGQAECQHDLFCYSDRRAAAQNNICMPRCDPDGANDCPSNVCVRLDVTSMGVIGVCQP